MSGSARASQGLMSVELFEETGGASLLSTHQQHLRDRLQQQQALQAHGQQAQGQQSERYGGFGGGGGMHFHR